MKHDTWSGLPLRLDADEVAKTFGLTCEERSSGEWCRRPATSVAIMDGIGSSLVCDECAEFYAKHHRLKLTGDACYVLAYMAARMREFEAALRRQAAELRRAN